MAEVKNTISVRWDYVTNGYGNPYNNLGHSCGAGYLQDVDITEPPKPTIGNPHPVGTAKAACVVSAMAEERHPISVRWDYFTNGYGNPYNNLGQSCRAGYLQDVDITEPPKPTIGNPHPVGTAKATCIVPVQQNNWNEGLQRPSASGALPPQK